MNKLKMNACAAYMLAPMLTLTLFVSGCASRPSAQLQPQAAVCPRPQAPAAWAMQPASNSLMLLDKTFSISAEE